MDRRSDPVVGVLVRARGLIDTPEKWGQGVNGCSMPKDGKRCVGIAVDQARDSADYDAWYGARRLLERAVGTAAVETWNDNHSHPEVLAALDRAIALRVVEIA